MEVGFIGVGRMGKAMARNLLKAGHRVRAWDTSKAALEEIAKDGAEIAASARDAFRGDAVMSMLPNDEAMRATFVAGDALPSERTSTVHVNSATASVACVLELTKIHAARGVPYVSAPVYGRPEMAAERNLNILAAGEAAALARAYKMQPSDVLDPVVGSIFDVPIYRIYAGLISSGTFEPPGFDLLLGLKDAKLALDAGEQVNVPLPFASVLRDNYLDAIAHGDAAKDWSSVSQVAARRAGLART